MKAALNKIGNSSNHTHIIRKYKVEDLCAGFGFNISNIIRLPRANKIGMIDIIEIKQYNFVTLNNKLVFNNWLSSFEYHDSSDELLIFSTIINDTESYGVFNKKGEIVIYPIYDNISFLKEDNNYLECKMRGLTLMTAKEIKLENQFTKKK